jgi:starvation-inducible DNA-binding protein
MKSLNEVLARELDLMLETWNYHWNVEGPLFPSLHALFESQYVILQEISDEIAERVRALGVVAQTRVNLTIAKITSTQEMLSNLATKHEALARWMQDELVPAYTDSGDPATADLLTQTLEKHDKAAWMLRATAK